MKTMMLSAALLLGTGCAVAQGPMEHKPAVNVGAPMEPAPALDAMLSLFEQEVTGVVKAMPADKFDFAPSAATFAAGSPAKFSGVRTFGQEVTHLISGNYYFYSQVSGTKPDVDMASLKNLKSKDEMVAALEASFAFAHKAVATITPANAFLTIQGADGMHTRTTLAAFAVAHGFDHYGQLVEYLRMNGGVPPGSK